MTKFFVTGGKGFIGTAFCSSARADGHRVVTFDWVDTGNDCHSVNALVEAIGNEDPYWVVHLAATPGVGKGVADCGQRDVMDILYTRNVLSAMNQLGKKRLLFVSTGSVYGDTSEELKTELSILGRQLSFYSASKLACESIISAWQNAYECHAVVLRLGTIIGPGNNKGLIKDFIVKLKLDKHELKVSGDGTAEKSFLDIRDLIEAMRVAMAGHDDTPAYAIYNVGAYISTSVRRVAEIVSSHLQLHPKMLFSDTKGGFVGDVPKICLDVTKLRNLGWSQTIPTELSIRENVDFILKNAMVS